MTDKNSIKSYFSVDEELDMLSDLHCDLLNISGLVETTMIYLGTDGCDVDKAIGAMCAINDLLSMRCAMFDDIIIELHQAIQEEQKETKSA